MAVGVWVGIGVLVTVGVKVGLDVGICVGDASSIGVDVYVKVGVAVSKGVREGVPVGIDNEVGLGKLGKRVAVGNGLGVTNGTSVGGINSVGVGVRVIAGSGVGTLHRQRTIKLAKPKQYRHEVVNITNASNRESSLCFVPSCPYQLKIFLTRLFPVSPQPKLNAQHRNYLNTVISPV